MTSRIFFLFSMVLMSWTAWAQTRTVALPPTPVATLPRSVASLPEALPLDLPSETNKLTVGGRVWANYTADLTSKSKHKTGFEIYRAFLQADYRYNKTWSVFTLLDHERDKLGSKNQDSKTWVYVRNAFIQASDLWGDKGTFRFGLQPTPFVAAVDGVTKARWLGKSLADEMKLLKTQDGGLSLSGASGSLLKYTAMVHNGTESLDLEGASDNALASTVQLSVFPFATPEKESSGLGWTLSNTHFFKSTNDKSAVNVVSTALTFGHRYLDTALEYVYYKERKKNSAALHAYGATLYAKFLESSALFARFQSGNDPLKTRYKSHSVLSVGPSYILIPNKVVTALVYERKAKGAGKTPEQTIFWNWAANF